MVTAEALSISEAAEQTGLTAHTLRYYERAGLMLDRVDRVGHGASSHRRYGEDDVRWVLLLSKLRATGMPIRAPGGDRAQDRRLSRAGRLTSSALERLALFA
jgi:hypothetical protein